MTFGIRYLSAIRPCQSDSSPGLPVCHETEGWGSLIPQPPFGGGMRTT
ncbi:hypothetical protein [Bacteroides sp. AF25-38AC]|nr:hypothetical protein [Bacteroides sp. AF25-38AC]